MQDTLALWEQFEAPKHDIYLSQMTLDEVGECREPKRTVLYEYLSRIAYTKLEITDEVLKVANQIIAMGILTPKSFDVCQHIATAVVHGCDCIISWNFKHIVNIKTIKGIRAITHLESIRTLTL